MQSYPYYALLGEGEKGFGVDAGRFFCDVDQAIVKKLIVNTVAAPLIPVSADVTVNTREKIHLAIIQRLPHRLRHFMSVDGDGAGACGGIVYVVSTAAFACNHARG